MNRLFFALAPTENERAAAERAAREIAMKHTPSGRAVPPEDYHVTLIFLGHMSEVNEMAARQAARTLRLDPFELAFDQAASFRNRDIPWWLGSRRPPARAAGELRDGLHRVLHGAGVPLPKRAAYVPHITFRRHEKTALAPTPVPAFEWRMSDFVLMRSHLEARPYEIVERFELSGKIDPEGEPTQPDQLSLL